MCRKNTSVFIFSDKLRITNNFIPIRLERLLGFVVAVVIIYGVQKIIGQVLLADIMIWIAVRIAVVLSFVLVVLAVKVLVLELTRYGADIAAPNFRDCGVNRLLSRI